MLYIEFWVGIIVSPLKILNIFLGRMVTDDKYAVIPILVPQQVKYLPTHTPWLFSSIFFFSAVGIGRLIFFFFFWGIFVLGVL